MSPAADGLRDSQETVRIALDLAIVAGLLAGKSDSVRAFAERMQCVPRILSGLNKRMGRPLDTHSLEDLAQQVIMVILQKLADFEGLSSIEGWAYRFCFFEMANWIRRGRKTPRSLQEATRLEEVSEVDQQDPWRFEDLYRALNRLPADERTVVHLKCLEGLTFETISKKLNTGLSTVKARYYRGLSTLRQVPSLSVEGQV